MDHQLKANFENRTLFCGDNLSILQGINKETIDLIATDPPFNKGRDFHATPDSLAAGARFQDRWSWEDDVQKDWVVTIKDYHPLFYELIDFIIGGIESDSKERKRKGGREDLAAFICWLGVRVMEMHRVLKPTGSMYLHCDPTASHYIKAMMDCIFGAKNFVNEIIWSYTSGGVSNQWFARKHDVILLYAKKIGNHCIHLPQEKSYTRSLPEPHTNSGQRLRVTRDAYCELCENGQHGQKYRMVSMRDVWTNVRSLFRNDAEMIGYPTQKPLALYERIIKASSNEGDVVLDPFCGCATTIVAAEKLNRKWVGIDLWENAYNVVMRRLESEQLTVPDDVKKNPMLIDKGSVRWEHKPPTRTDGDDTAPFFEMPLSIQYPLMNWQKIKGKELFAKLVEFQSENGEIICMGCGRGVEPEFVQVDHKEPKSGGGSNYIDNMILLCAFCNSKKSNVYTLAGLWIQNKKKDSRRDGNHAWMHDFKRAERVHDYWKISVKRLKDLG